MLIAILYQLIMFIEYYILLGGFKIGYEILDLQGVDAMFYVCRADREFILCYVHEYWVDIMRIHASVMSMMGGHWNNI